MDIVIKIYQAFEYKHKLTYLVHVIRANILCPWMAVIHNMWSRGQNIIIFRFLPRQTYSCNQRHLDKTIVSTNLNTSWYNVFFFIKLNINNCKINLITLYYGHDGTIILL